MLNRIFLRTHHLRCPDEHDLAAYVDQQLIGAERERVESHLARCDACLQQVGFLIREAHGATPVAARLLASARRLQTAQRNSPRIWEWGAVAAAIGVVATSAVLWREARPKPAEERPIPVAAAQRPQPPGIPSNGNSEAGASVRSGSPGVSLPVVLSPRSGATVPAADFIIRWEPIANAAAYEVRVVTADGNLVWRERVRGTLVKPPNLTVQAGKKYFVWVRALLPDGETQLSAAVSFIGG